MLPAIIYFLPQTSGSGAVPDKEGKVVQHFTLKGPMFGRSNLEPLPPQSQLPIWLIR